jgi:hypothetical protein
MACVPDLERLAVVEADEEVLGLTDNAGRSDYVKVVDAPSEDVSDDGQGAAPDVVR